MRNGFANHGSGCGDSRGSLHSSQRRGIETLPSIGSAENCATVHVNRLSSDSACQAGAEKQRRLRDLVRGLTSSLQNGTQKAGQLLLLAYVQLARELSTKLLAHASFSYRSRTDRIDAHALARGFSGVVASQPEQTRFRRGVCRTPTECRLCGNARNVQDNPAFARVHSGQYQLAQQERRTQMN